MRRPSPAPAVYAPFLAGWGVWLLTSVVGSRRLRRSRPRPAAPPGVTVDVLIPAHDEERSIGGVVRTLLEDDRDAVIRRVVVVADHCADDTARAARAAGAEVLVRERGPRGKPAALRDGLEALRGDDPADGVLFLDADVSLERGFVARLARELAGGADAVQSSYLAARAGTGEGDVELGIYLRNLLRPAGLTALGCPAHLTGTGMLLSRRALSAAAFGDHLAEDLALTQDLVAAGIYPRLVPEARLHSDLPDAAGLESQRRRWEGGQLATLRRVPRLAWSLARTGRLRGLVGIADWCSPPLTVGVAVFGAVAGGHTLAVAARRARPAGLAWPLAAAATLACYLTHGARAHAGPGAARALARRVPAYAAWKIGVYARLARQPQVTWQRTPRESTAAPAPEPRTAAAAADQGR